MNIKTVKKAKYQSEVTSYEVTTEEGTYLSVPLVEDNRHYQEILAGVAAGNTIEEAD